MFLDPDATAECLPYIALSRAVADVLLDDTVQVPPRLVERLSNGGSLFVMPAHDRDLAITKVITFVADNATRQLPSIQGDIVAFDVASGRRIGLLDGPTVTARRTAAVSLLAAQRLASAPAGPLLIVGAGVQGRAHLEAFRAGLGTTTVRIASRSTASADALVAHARGLGMEATRVDDPDRALADCPLVVTCTSAQAICMRGLPRDDAFIAAVGAFTPQMVEWAPDICRQLAAQGTMVVDTRDADHEAGDLLQAGLDVSALPTLADVVRANPAWAQRPPRTGPVMFKSCGWAGWDLAAARCALRGLSSTPVL